MPRDSVTRCGAGEDAQGFAAGDFILAHGDAWTSKLIRFGQRLRIHGDDRKYTHWNHAAIVVSEGGDLIEALGAGVLRTHLSKYRPAETTSSASPQTRTTGARQWRSRSGRQGHRTGAGSATASSPS